MGRISKKILDDINGELRNVLQLNQWINTKSVIEWFVVLDIKEFYPSVNQRLLKNAINFAKQYINIKKLDLDTIMHARKSLLYSEGNHWIKRESGLFDVTMGAEVCGIVAMYLLSLLSSKCNKEKIGLYRDDGLAVLRNVSGHQSDKLKKEFQNISKENDLKIEIRCNLKIVDCLDATLNLNDGTYKPYRRPNDETLYINAKSNHPPNIVKQLPISIEYRLRILSSNENILDEAALHYQDVLNKCGYDYKLSYNPHNQNCNKESRSRKRKRNIIWFNPPFSKNVFTNVAKYFLNLVNKHFPPNIRTVINTHNKKITSDDKPPSAMRTCDCARNTICPMEGNCLSENTLCTGSVTSSLRNYGEKKSMQE